MHLVLPLLGAITSHSRGKVVAGWGTYVAEVQYLQYQVLAGKCCILCQMEYLSPARLCLALV